MALVTLPSGETIVESPGPTLDYYRGEGYPIADEAAPVTLPRVFDGEQYVGEQSATVSETNQQLADATDALTLAVTAANGDGDAKQVEQLPEGEFAEPVGDVQAASGRKSR